MSVVVPVLDEEAEIAATLATTRDPHVIEVLVVDGGSRDATVAAARRFADRVIPSAPGRAVQMNRAAGEARGEVLLFLHGDTRLPPAFGEAICGALAAGAVGGRFDVTLRGEHPLLPVIAAGINLRSRLSGIATGDQAIFVRRDVFDALGGYPAIPLMEDVWLTARLRRTGGFVALHEHASTSARRWETRGVLRTVLLMWWLRFAYAMGASPAWLARQYSGRRRASPCNRSRPRG